MKEFRGSGWINQCLSGLSSPKAILWEVGPLGGSLGPQYKLAKAEGD